MSDHKLSKYFSILKLVISHQGQICQFWEYVSDKRHEKNWVISFTTVDVQSLIFPANNPRSTKGLIYG